MKKKYPNEFKFFDEEEKELIESFEEALDKGEWKSIMTPKMKRDIEAAARNTPADYHGGSKDAEVFVLETDTIKKLKSKAKKRGLSYKDLASSILQKFANS